MIYNAAYKCRICGGVLIDQQTANADIARDCVFHQNFDDSLWPHNSGVKPPLYASHGCDDGSIGLADFIGMGAAERAGAQGDISKGRTTTVVSIKPFASREERDVFILELRKECDVVHIESSDLRDSELGYIGPIVRAEIRGDIPPTDEHSVLSFRGHKMYVGEQSWRAAI